MAMTRQEALALMSIYVKAPKTAKVSVKAPKNCESFSCQNFTLAKRATNL